MLGRDLLNTHLAKAIGDGVSTRVWTDQWISPKSIGSPTGPAMEIDQDLMVAGLLCRGTNEWNATKVMNLFPSIANEILSIRPSVMGAMDRYVWPPNKDGCYSAKSRYITAIKNHTTLDADASQSLELQWTKKIWSATCSPKIKLFMWKLCKEPFLLELT